MFYKIIFFSLLYFKGKETLNYRGFEDGEMKEEEYPTDMDEKNIKRLRKLRKEEAKYEEGQK